MKKIISIAFAAILAGLAISCQKEEFVSEKTDAVQYTFNIIVNDRAGFDSDASTKSSESHKSYWENGDKIFLFFKPTTDDNLLNTYATLTYDGSEWGVNAPGLSGLGEDGTLSAVYVYNLDGNVYPEFSSDDNQWTIATGNTFYNCQTGVDYTVSDNVISASINLVAPTDFVRFYVEGATGALTCDNVKGWKNIAIGSDMAVSNVTCTGYMDGFTNSGDSNVKEYYGRIVDGTSLDGTFLNGKDCEFSVVKNGKVYERTATPSSNARSFYMEVRTDGTNPWTVAEGKLPGLFTVGNGADGTAGTADDVQVRFSQGNLTCDISGATPDWKFYEHQYNCATAYDANLISLFTWGYDADKSIIPDGNASDNVSITSGNLSPTQDWGSKIGDGNTWRTLTSAEWQYLFNSRKMSNNGAKSENLTSSGITVESVTFKGVVLFPDDFTEQDTWKTKYTTWKALNDAGLVFLPIAGHREADQLKTLNNGFYWSSSIKDESNANSLVFDKNYCLPEGYTKRNWGASVRLISDIK